jgi:hypothetical protein
MPKYLVYETDNVYLLYANSSLSLPYKAEGALPPHLSYRYIYCCPFPRHKNDLNCLLYYYESSA